MPVAFTHSLRQGHWKNLLHISTVYAMLRLAFHFNVTLTLFKVIIPTPIKMDISIEEGNYYLGQIIICPSYYQRLEDQVSADLKKKIIDEFNQWRALPPHHW